MVGSFAGAAFLVDMTKRVVIVGGGVSGLVASYVFSQAEGVDCRVLEPNVVGGEFLAGGLKYIHRTADVEVMFNDLDVIWSDFTVRGGILLRGKVLRYPNCFSGMDPEQAKRIQADHYRKTRRAEGGAHSRTAMNDPAATAPRRALRCHFPDMVDQLSRAANVLKFGVKKVAERELILDDGSRMPYDYLVLTIPLWVIREIVDFYVPHGIAMNLNLANVFPRRDRYAHGDYVYTPYTPADSVHRISPLRSGYSVEVNGELHRDRLASDLNFIFKDGWALESVQEGLKGHLLPLETEAEWPDNIAPLGRFAQWDPRATMDVALDGAKKLAERWL